MDDALSWLQASRQSDIASLERLRQTGKLITTVSELVHQLQRERGGQQPVDLFARAAVWRGAHGK